MLVLVSKMMDKVEGLAKRVVKAHAKPGISPFRKKTPRGAASHISREQGADMLALVQLLKSSVEINNGRLLSGFMTLRASYKHFGALPEETVGVKTGWRLMGKGFFTAVLACLPEHLKGPVGMLGFEIDAEHWIITRAAIAQRSLLVARLQSRGHAHY